MFKLLSDRFSGIFDSLTRRGALSEKDVTTALREVRYALIEADVALEVVYSLIESIQDKAVGAEVLKSVTPGQMIIKIVYDELVAILGQEEVNIDLKAPTPIFIMMVGLQGSGKTTTTGKLAKRLTEQHNKKVLMVSLDVRRPAAQEQLYQLGERTGIKTLPIIEGQSPIQIAKRAIQAGKLSGYDIVILDTAGCNHIDESLMFEMAEIRSITNPHEILLVSDALTGQDSVNIAQNFDTLIGITGLVLTRIDGDGRGGAALSMRAVTGKPIKLIGTGENIEALEYFYPKRIADRILGRGDIITLVEKASENINSEKAQSIADKIQKGLFDMDDLSEQLNRMSKLGGIGDIISMMPGINKMKKQIEDSGITDNVFSRQKAIISSMTRKERKEPKLLNASRKKRIASGSGSTLQEINRLLKIHRQMARMMKAMGGKRNKDMLSKMINDGLGREIMPPKKKNFSERIPPLSTSSFIDIQPSDINPLPKTQPFSPFRKKKK